jgi:uncharacterized membrane protein YvlD (DUF360 family)
MVVVARPEVPALAWYPREFRREKEQEILAVLLADAPDGQRRPGLAASADLIRGGLWMRLRPSVPRSARTVRAAVKLMYAGAAVSAVEQIIVPALIIADIKVAARGRLLGHSLTAAQMRPLIVTVWIIFSLVVIALWLWMARAVGRGRNWARILSTVLFGLWTLQLISDLQGAVSSGTAEPVLGLLGAALTWPVGAAAVWLLWRPASRAFFRPPRLPRLV